MDDSLQTTVMLDLIDRIRLGDRLAADELIRRAAIRLEALAARMLEGYPDVRRWEQADDVLQNALQRLLASLKAVRPESTDGFFGFAACVIRRELIDLARHYRRKANPHIESLPDDSRAAPADAAATPEENLNLEKWSSFHEAIDRLPDKERIIIELCFYEGLTQNEMARVLRVDEKTVRRRWKRATANLVARLGKDIPR